MKLQCVLVATVLLVSASGLAARPLPWGGRPPAAVLQPREPGPASVLRNRADQLISFLQQDPAPSRAEIRRYLDAELAPYFDFAYMTRWALGKRYWRLSAEERSAAELRLQDSFLGALSKRLGAYGKGGVRVGAPRRVRAGEVDVALDLLNPRVGYPTRVNFRFYRSGAGWKVFDVSAQGVSALMHFRRVFQRVYRRPLGSVSPGR